MSTPSVTAGHAAPSSGPLPGAVRTARVRLVQAVLTVGVVAVVSVLLVRPGAGRSDRSYAAVAAGRDAAWTGHLVECVGYGLTGLGLALAACLVVRARGAVWAETGAVLVTLGGILFAATSYALGVFDWYATATAALPAPSGAALLAYAQDDPGRLAAADVAGFMLLTVGSLLICVALWRSRAVPRTLPAVVAVLTLAQFAIPQNRLLDVEQALLVASFLGVAFYAGRPTDRPHQL